MHKSLILALFFFSHISCTSSSDNGIHHDRRNNSGTKLFVFGDSYVDTGNWNSVASAWKVPYGITFPGTPAGRFSDGRVLTDYVASYFVIESPIPYEKWNTSSEKRSEFGMNFAYGGTGVFDTDISKPNMSSQIDIFENLIKQAKVFTNIDLNSSIALVSVGGNDYSNYLKHGAKLSLPEFTKTVVDQLVMDLERIQRLGVPKIAVTSMEPLGCLPAITFLNGYTNCTQSLNDATSFHNQLLQQAVDKLNTETHYEAFFILDVYDAILSAVSPPPGSSMNGDTLLTPCCVGTTSDYSCGSVEGSEAKYSVCNDRNSAFFWDAVHPAQNGWNLVYKAIQPALKRIL